MVDTRINKRLLNQITYNTAGYKKTLKKIVAYF